MCLEYNRLDIEQLFTCHTLIYMYVIFIYCIELKILYFNRNFFILSKYCKIMNVFIPSYFAYSFFFYFIFNKGNPSYQFKGFFHIKFKFIFFED